MEELVARINKVREYKGLTSKALSNEIGIKYTTMNNYLNGNQPPSAEFIKRILDLFVDISAEWLMRGEGSMIKKANKDEELIKELADTKVKLLVAEGITRKLTEIVEGRMTSPKHNEE